MTRFERAVIRAFTRSAPVESVPPLVAPPPARAPVPTSDRPRRERDWTWPPLAEQLLARAPAGFAQLAEQLGDAARSGKNVIAFVSPGRDEGRTTLVLAAARQIAQSSLQTLLIDADLDHPGLAAQLELDARIGLTEVAADLTRWPEGVIWKPGSALAVLPAGRPTPPELRADFDQRFGGVLQHARQVFDLVLLDGGCLPVERLRQAAWARRDVDAFLLISSRQRRSEALLNEEFRHWHAAGIDPLGVIETFA